LLLPQEISAHAASVTTSEENYFGLKVRSSIVKY